MDDKFYKQFKRNLENRPEPSFDPKLWRRLEKNLDREGDEKPKGVAWWALAALLLLSCGSNLWFWTKFQETEQSISQLIAKTDTIFQTKIIYQTDTIFQTREITKRVVKYVSKPQNAFFAANKLPNESFVFKALETPSLLEDLTHAKSGFGIYQQANGISQTEFLPSSILNFLPYAATKKLAIEIKELKINETTPVLDNQKKTTAQRLYAMRPKGFRMGVEGGFVRPMGDSFNNSGGYTMGLNAQIDFSPQLRMWANAAFVKISFESSQMGADIGIPLVNPPSDDFDFEVAEVSQPAFQYSIGMQYLWRPDKKLKPFIGIGYGAVSLLPYEITYDFKNEAAGFEWSFEEKINQNELVTDFLLLQSGLEYEISNHWFWQLRAGYRTNLKKSGIQSPQLFSLTTGVGYNF